MALPVGRAVLIVIIVDKLKEAAAEISESTGNSQLSILTVDLGNFASIRKAAAEALEMAPTLDVLINNAGVMACPLDRTSEGHEMQFGTNHVGHFLFTCLIVPALKASGNARIVNLSSGGHKFSAVNLDDWETHDTRALVPGLAVTIEPGIYLPDFGVRSEIDVFMDEDGPRVTTEIQRRVVLI